MQFWQIIDPFNCCVRCLAIAGVAAAKGIKLLVSYEKDSSIQSF
jgi:hypothetical protein